MNIKKDIVVRVRIMFLMMLIFALAIVGRIVILQTIDGDKWRKKASLSYVKERTVEAVRGNIYADDGSLLATSLPKYRLGFDPLVTMRNPLNIKIYDEGIDSLCTMLADFYQDKSAKEYFYQIDFARRAKVNYIMLNNKLIDYQAVKEMRKWPIFRFGKFKGGVVFEKVTKRYNPFGSMASRAIGYKKDQEQVGIENSFDKELAGKAGKGIFEKIAGGSWRPIEGGEGSIPIPGVDVHTTINVNIQDVAETSLRNALKRYNAEKGCVIVMEVATGEIKAMANLTNVNDTSYVENYNHAVLSRTDPGSVFKLASMVALMEEANISNDEWVNTGNGSMMIGSKRLEDSGPHGYGTITAQQVFEHSSNVGIAKLMLKYFGEQKQQAYYDYLHKFHLDQPLDFQIKPDIRPIINRPKGGDPTALPWNSIGYGTGLTPLQMLAFYNAIANNGKWIQPIIVKSTKIADNIQTDYKLSQRVYEEPICGENTLEKVRKMLVGVVERGTASNIKNPLYKIAGKTGTSQKLVNGKYQPGRYYTSFIGFFPAETPKYSIAVMIDNPRGMLKEALFAAEASAPVFKEVADKIYACDIQMHKPLGPSHYDPRYFATNKLVAHSNDLKAITNEFEIEVAPEEEGWMVVKKANDDYLDYKQYKNSKNKIPDTRGMSLRDALFILENKGIKVSYKGIGKVVSQSITPGSSVNNHKSITLTLR